MMIRQKKIQVQNWLWMHGWLHSEILKGRGNFGELGVDGRIILRFFAKLIMRSGLGRAGSNVDPWWDVVNTVTKLCIL